MIRACDALVNQVPVFKRQVAEAKSGQAHYLERAQKLFQDSIDELPQGGDAQLLNLVQRAYNAASLNVAS